MVRISLLFVLIAVPMLLSAQSIENMKKRELRELARQLEAENEKLKKETAQLKRDSDNDGIPDYLDKEERTPHDATVDSEGVTLDTDGDGIPDYKDQEPCSPCPERQIRGVSIDTDDDGVPDCLDDEPNSQRGKRVDVHGVAIEGEDDRSDRASKIGRVPGELEILCEDTGTQLYAISEQEYQTAIERQEVIDWIAFFKKQTSRKYRLVNYSQRKFKCEQYRVFAITTRGNINQETVDNMCNYKRLRYRGGSLKVN